MDAATVMQRCEVLGGVSEEPGLLVRPYGTRAMREVNDLVAGWMRGAGMTVREDAIGNIVGRYEGTGERTFLLGSHLDTVRDAGKYDGSLGVLVALACVERLRARGVELPFAVEVVGFADEEGLRYGTTYLGSSVFAGAFDPGLLDLEDADGVTLAEAVRSFGGAPDALVGNGCGTLEPIGYCEVHIEQGPVLERQGLPVGVVSGIVGQSRVGVGFVGEAGHAGTVPMDGRRDALCAAAEFVLAVEQAARGEPGAVATVGAVTVHPGAGNVIPGEASLGLDLRHGEDRVRERLRHGLREKAESIAAARGCELRWRVRQESCATPTDPGLTALFERAISGLGYSVERLPSGAGHDAAQMSGIAPISMLFVRCKGGISHNPAESVAERDVAAAIETMSRFLKLVAEHDGRRA